MRILLTLLSWLMVTMATVMIVMLDMIDPSSNELTRHPENNIIIFLAVK